VPVVAAAASVNDADDRTARGRRRQQEETQSRRPTAEGMPRHHDAARKHEQQQHDDLKPTQKPMQAAMMTANVFAHKDQSVEQHDRPGKDVDVKRRPVGAGESRLAALQEERIEIGRKIIGIARQNRDQHPQNQQDREPAKSRC